MSEIPNEMKYAATHEWARLEEDGTVTVGISDHAQQALGDVVYVELPEVESNMSAEENCGVIESVKAASDMYCPLDGEITEVNEELDGEPELINTAPFGEGWIFSMKISSTDQLSELMDADEYESFCQE